MEYLKLKKIIILRIKKIKANVKILKNILLHFCVQNSNYSRVY